MSYRHIENLYRNRNILLFKQCYALCKVHGTSSNVKYSNDKLSFFSGGANHEHFVSLFNQEELLSKFRENAKQHPNTQSVTIYGEAYGGKMQGMKDTYGPNLKFISFEILINDNDWFSVPQAEKFASSFGLDFVPYELIDATEEAINNAMMADSVVAVRNGMGTGKMREGVVLRPTVELIHPNDGRIICKYKRPEFSEREHTPKFTDPEQLKVLEKAKEIVDEWVVPERLRHILDAFPNSKMEDINKIIKAMVEDVYREAKSEIVESKEVNKQIGKKTVKLFKRYLNETAI